jgi:hypothetical protein
MTKEVKRATPRQGRRRRQRKRPNECKDKRTRRHDSSAEQRCGEDGPSSVAVVLSRWTILLELKLSRRIARRRRDDVQRRAIHTDRPLDERRSARTESQPKRRSNAARDRDGMRNWPEAARHRQLRCDGYEGRRDQKN